MLLSLNSGTEFWVLFLCESSRQQHYKLTRRGNGKDVSFLLIISLYKSHRTTPYQSATFQYKSSRLVVVEKMNRHLAIFLLVLGLVCSSSLGKPSPEEIFKQVAPCVNYVTDKGAKPAKGCCDGVRQLRDWGKSHADRVDICNCLKEGAKQVPDLDQKRVVALPQLCGVDYRIPLDPNMDCNT
ncbi:hypothetical protein ACLOJK_010273 [Asimina triloba]